MTQKLKGLHAGVAGLLGAAALVSGDLAQAFQYEFHGDLNNRFQLYSNQRDWFRGAGLTGKRNRLLDDGKDDNFGEIKYRLWTNVGTDNGEVKGVYAVEIGGIRFGEGSGGDFSGDGTNVETRWAYVDFGIPTAMDQRVTVGLQPISVNKHLWQETVTGVKLSGPMDAVPGGRYQLLWGRGDEAAPNDDPNEVNDDGFSGADNFALNLDGHLAPGLKAGAFVLYQRNDQTSEGTGTLDVINYEIKSIADNSKYSIFNFGTDGSFTTPVPVGQAFFNWNLIYQTGEIEDVALTTLDGSTGPAQDFDLNAFFGRADLGVDTGMSKLTYTFWYSSGDDSANDDDLDAFIATDVDINESMIFQENMTDDDYFAETHYLLDKGYIFNKLQLDHKVTPKVTASGMVIYNMLAEDVTLADGSKDNALGVEFGGRLSYKPFPSLELATEAAYLLAGDAMDAFEESAIQDGDGDQNIFHWAARIRYKF